MRGLDTESDSVGWAHADAPSASAAKRTVPTVAGPTRSDPEPFPSLLPLDKTHSPFRGYANQASARCRRCRAPITAVVWFVQDGSIRPRPLQQLDATIASCSGLGSPVPPIGEDGS